MATRRAAREWRALVAGWQQSGRSADEYAREHGVSGSRLRWWRWKLGDQPVLMPVDVSDGEIANAAPLASGGAGSTVDVLIGDRLRIRVTDGFDEVLLRRVVAALEAP